MMRKVKATFVWVTVNTPFNKIDKGHLSLIIGFSTILLLMLLLTFIALNRVTVLNQQLQQMVSHNYQKVLLLEKMQKMARDRVFSMQVMLLLDDPFEIDEIALKIDDYGANFAAARKQLLSLSLNREERELLEKQNSLIHHGLPIQREASSHIVAGRFAAGRQLFLSEVIPAQQQLISILENLEAIQTQAITEMVQQAELQHTATRPTLSLSAARYCYWGSSSCC